MVTPKATRAFVRAALTGQLDKSGVPMSDHAERVAAITLRFTDDPEAYHVAMLHDVLEDTDTTYQDLLDLGYSERVADIVDVLTHRKEFVSYNDYVRKVASYRDPLARIVKLADNLDNSAPYRHVKLDAETSEAFLLRYDIARQILAGTDKGLPTPELG